jgi:hypothetical protein
VLFGRDSCRGVLKIKSFATDNGLRESSELEYHPCTLLKLSNIYVILYLKVVVTSLISNQGDYLSDSVLRVCVIFLAGDRPKYNRDGTS